MKKYVNNSFITKSPSEYKNGTAAVTNLPVTIYTDGQPVSSYTLKGNTSVSGTPSPSNPITIEGVGVKTANLSPNNTFTNTTTDTRSYLSLAFQAYSDSGFLNQNLTNVTESKKAIVTLTAASGTTRLTVVHNGATQNIRIVPYFSAEAGKYTLVADVTGYNPTVEGGIVLSNIMILSGEYTLETIPPYEPYGYKISISSNGTALSPMYLTGQLMAVESADTLSSSGTVTYQYKKYEIIGTEDTISGYTNSAGKLGFSYERLNMVSNSRTNGVCSHFVPIQSISWTTTNSICFGANNQTIYFIFSDAMATQYNLTDITSIKQWLADQYAAGTPVTIVYPLATPTTETVTAPTITTTGGTVTLDVDTTVKPSELDLTYHGWHEHEPLKRENGSWS